MPVGARCRAANRAAGTLGPCPTGLRSAVYGPPAVMGVVNVTPDSFSDGGRFLDAGAAVEHGLALVAAGADVLDVGGESTRPGAEPGRCRRGAAAASRPSSTARRRGRRPGQHRHDEGRGRRGRARVGRLDRQRRLRRPPRPGPARRGRGCRRGLRRDAHAGRAPHDAARPVLRRRRRRGGRRSSSNGSTTARAAGIRGRCAGRGSRHRLRQDGRAQPRAARRASRARRAYRRAARRRYVAEVLPSRRLVGDDSLVARDDATLATVVWSVDHGARVVRVHDARSSVPRTPAAGCHGRLCRVRGRWAQGLEPRGFCWIIKDRLAGLGAAGRVRPQPSQGPAPGGADLARRQRVHPRPVAARLPAQPARLRRGVDRLRPRPARAARRVAGPAARRSTRRSPRWLDDPDEKVLVHHEEFGERLMGVLAGLPPLHRQGHRRARTRSSSSSGSPAASSARPVARSSRSRSTRGSCGDRATPQAGPAAAPHAGPAAAPPGA